MSLAVEGAFVYVLIAVTILPLMLWGLERARRALDERDAKKSRVILRDSYGWPVKLVAGRPVLTNPVDWDLCDLHETTFPMGDPCPECERLSFKGN
jgi:hypothetical protein